MAENDYTAEQIAATVSGLRDMAEKGICSLWRDCLLYAADGFDAVAEQRKELRTTVHRLCTERDHAQAALAEAVEVLRELADDLAGYIEAHYGASRHQYPSQQLKYEREMAVVHTALAFLAQHAPERRGDDNG